MRVDGKSIAKRLEEEMKNYIEANNLSKKLAIFYVGNNPVIDQFIKIKQNFGKRVGVFVEIFRYEEEIEEDFLIKEIKEKSESFDGALVQLPLPSHINKLTVLNSIKEEKDIDVLSRNSYKNFLIGKNKMLPPVAFAVFQILKNHNVLLGNKKVCVVGDGLLVGRPVYDWFKLNNVKAEIVNLETENPEALIKDADILVSGVGVPNLIKKEMIKKGAVILDAGSSQESGAVVGDISIECEEMAEIFSGVPGGIGPLTVVGLFSNLVYN